MDEAVVFVMLGDAIGVNGALVGHFDAFIAICSFSIVVDNAIGAFIIFVVIFISLASSPVDPLAKIIFGPLQFILWLIYFIVRFLRRSQELTS